MTLEGLFHLKSNNTGVRTDPLLKLMTGRCREVDRLIYIFSALFVLRYVFLK